MKFKGNGNNWHGHVTAVTCAPAHRRLGLAGRLMDALEKISEQKKCMFVDLFVRVSNAVAITMYRVSFLARAPGSILYDDPLIIVPIIIHIN